MQWGKILKKQFPSLTCAISCDTVCVAEGGDANGEVYIRRNYVW